MWTLWYPKEYLTNIFVAAELQFRVHTGKEVCHKICVDKIVDILFQKPVLRSKWNMLVEECGCEITKVRSIHHFPRSDPITVYQITVFFLCKEHRSKIQNSAKGNQEERPRIQMCRVNVPPFFSPSTYL